MSASQSLAPRAPASLETVHNVLGSLAARYRQEEVLTSIRQIPAPRSQVSAHTGLGDKCPS